VRGSGLAGPAAGRRAATSNLVPVREVEPVTTVWLTTWLVVVFWGLSLLALIAVYHVVMIFWGLSLLTLIAVYHVVMIFWGLSLLTLIAVYHVVMIFRG
jgi:hypothetical protein